MQQSMPNLVAGGTVRPKRYVKVGSGAAHQGLECDANELAVGVSAGDTLAHDSANHATTGELITLQTGIEHEIEAEGAITQGDLVESDVDGKAITATLTGTVSRNIMGVALETAADGEVIRIKWQPFEASFADNANIIQTTVTRTLTNSDNGAIISCDTTSNDIAITLPTAVDGLHFVFMIPKAGANDLEIISPSATNYFHGGVIHLDANIGGAGIEVATIVSNYSSNDYLTLLIAAAGTRIEMICDGTLWYVAGTVISDTPPVFADTSGL